ncbi:MAG: response regulator, partial [Steroidobacteraceae bacterium]
FEILLPLTAAPSVVASAEAPMPLNRRRVLIVDDNRDAADSLSLLLQLHGHEVRTAYGGEEALEVATAYDADFVLLDIGLPTINGYEVARRLRSQGFAAQLVALTGYGQPEDVRRARDAGFDGHVVKPVDPERLLESLAV